MKLICQKLIKNSYDICIKVEHYSSNKMVNKVYVKVHVFPDNGYNPDNIEVLYPTFFFEEPNHF